MKEDGGTPTASSDDPRLTKFGSFLRKTKLDELPTLWNLIKGDIAIVGPRPDVPDEIESLHPEIRKIVLSVKPGIISPATLWNCNEDAILRGTKDPHKVYCEQIKPIKYRLNTWYVNNKSAWLDFKCLLAYALSFLGFKWPPFPKELIEN